MTYKAAAYPNGAASDFTVFGGRVLET